MPRRPRKPREFTPATEANGVVAKSTPRGNITSYKLLALAEDRNPWDLQPDEPPRCYGWFALYRDMPPHERSIMAVCELVTRSKHTMYNISSRDRWRERVAAWDAEELRKWVLRQDAARRRTVGSHLRLSDEMIRIAMARLRTLDPERLSIRDLPLFVDVAAKIGRAALGLDTPAVLAATQINVDRGAGAADAEHQAAQEEAAEVAARVMSSLANLADRMTEEQRAQAVATWVPPRAIEGEVVPG